MIQFTTSKPSHETHTHTKREKSSKQPSFLPPDPPFLSTSLYLVCFFGLASRPPPRSARGSVQLLGSTTFERCWAGAGGALYARQDLLLAPPLGRGAVEGGEGT